MSFSSNSGGTGTQEATRDAGTFVIGPRGIIEDVDEAACELLGYSRDDLLGLHGSELIPPEIRPSTAASLDRMRRGELSVRQGRLLRKDGGSIGVEVTAQLLSDGRLGLNVRKS
jgi:PAS domain S-box-containing protein